MDVGNRLNEIRILKQYSVYKLSQLSDVSSTYIHEIERGEKQPTVEIINKLCKALNISLSDFFDKNPYENQEIISTDKLVNNLNELSQEELKVINNLVRIIINKK